MKLKRRKRMHSAVDAGSLSDILFILMLFFLMISTLASPEAIKILLPSSGTGATIPKHAISITVNDKVEWYLEATPVNQETLGPLLAAEVQKHTGEEITVILKLDKNLSVQEMLKVVDVINKQKLPIMIATEKKN